MPWRRPPPEGGALRRLARKYSTHLGMASRPRRDRRRLQVVVDGATLPSAWPSRVMPVAQSNGADAGPEEELLRLHPARTGHDRDEGPHDRHEPAQHQRASAVRSKNSWVCTMCFGFRIREFGFLNSVVPTLADVVAGDVAEERRDGQDHAGEPEWTLMVPAAMNRPTANSSESPGRIGNNSPHSMNTTNAVPEGPVAQPVQQLLRSIQSGTSIATRVSTRQGSVPNCAGAEWR